MENAARKHPEDASKKGLDMQNFSQFPQHTHCDCRWEHYSGFNIAVGQQPVIARVGARKSLNSLYIRTRLR